MGASDAIVIGEAWISEHFFTTDAKSQSFLAKVVERRKAWDDADVETTRSRFLAARGDLESTLASLSERVERAGDDAATARIDAATAKAELAADLATLTKTLVGVLGFDRDGLVVDRDGPLQRISTPGLTGAAPLVIVEAWPVDSPEALLAKDADTLLTPYVVDEENADKPITSVARLLSTLFVADDAPRFALVLAGRWALVAEQERWAEGRYLAVDLQLVCERNDTKRGGEIDRALTCLGPESLAPNADGDIWWTATLEESVKHTVGVSQDLREGVRLSIEIIANEVVARRREQGLDPLPADQAQPLAKQSLRFLYRILFLLYAEASPELGVLPVGAPEYQQGYSLDRLRDLTLVELTTLRSRAGTHLYDSLDVLFRLVDRAPDRDRTTEPGVTEGLTFRQLRADLFKPEAVKHISDVRLGNVAVQQVLRNLLLSKESRGRDRGFISYAELGINQLGAVYEGLMSYTGFFAEEDLYEVAKGGDASKGSWVVPVDRADGITENDFVRTTDPVTSEAVPVLHQRGTFVYRLSGRDRQQSASYYTPEVLTRFTVGQALDELLGEKTEKMTAREILDLTICEPALGSGAFAIEAVRQLAERYLRKRQEELGETIDPDEYPKRLQEVKAYLALHQVYGVDLNATAVELAEISLWLDTMGESLDAPWFGLHLRRGNSLIGARRAMFRLSQVEKKTWLKDVPEDWPLADVDTDLLATDPAAALGGRIHHFLLPAEGWGSAVDVREAKELAPEALERLKVWRKTVLVKPTKAQQKQLADLAIRVEQLWQLALARLRIAEQEIRRSIPVWGATDLPVGGSVQREQIEAALHDARGALGRLTRVMDAWCALWFWPLTDTWTTEAVDGVRVRIQPPSFDQWIDALQQLLGRHEGKKRGGAGQERLTSGISWDELSVAESLDLGFASAASVEAVKVAHPWLATCEAIADRYGFFHWQIGFAPAFANRGGFDVHVGNPPWVRPKTDVDALLAEGDPWWQLSAEQSPEQRMRKRVETLALTGVSDGVLDGATDSVVVSAFLGSSQQFRLLVGLQPDLYRCFMERVWENQSERGVSGLIHLETHFTDEKAGVLRENAYLRLRRHWHFINELKLFDIQHQRMYGVNIYGSKKDLPNFRSASYLYHPETAIRSVKHSGIGDEPGLKTLDGNWDVRPHLARVIDVTSDSLATWLRLLDDGIGPVGRARMLHVVNASSAAVLDRLTQAQRVGSLSPWFSQGWREDDDVKKGRIGVDWGRPSSWSRAVVQGPSIHVANLFHKFPNSTMLHQTDYHDVDLESLARDEVPITAYKVRLDDLEADAAYTRWGDEVEISARTLYRVAWRSMAAPTGERTLMPVILPPGVSHLKQSIFALGSPDWDASLIARVAAFLSSLCCDLAVRVAPKSGILYRTVAQLPFERSGWIPEIALRILRLSCLTEAFSALWEEAYMPEFAEDSWTTDQLDGPLGGRGASWGESTPLRVAAERRQALLEIDVLVSMCLGVGIDQLCSVYRTQFPVLMGKDRARVYDRRGRLVPKEVLLRAARGEGDLSADERTATNTAGNTYTYELPFRPLDREHDMRVAYAGFERRLRERS